MLFGLHSMNYSGTVRTMQHILNTLICSPWTVKNKGMSNTAFSSNVVSIREQLGWSRAELQRRLEENSLPLHMTTIRRLESGDQEPKAIELLAFAKTLGVPMEELMMEPSGEAPWLRKMTLALAKHRDSLRAFANAYQAALNSAAALGTATRNAVAHGATAGDVLEATTLLRETSDNESLIDWIDASNNWEDIVQSHIDKIQSELRNGNG